MPYIKSEERKKYGHLEEIGSRTESVGQLNYVLTKIILGFIYKQGPSYSTYNSVLGVLSAIDKELYRRLISSYEDTKISENGDIF